MSDTAPLLITHAGSASPACLAVLRELQLPHLSALLAALTPGPIERLPDEAFDTPDERAAARLQGLPDNGRTPWAALYARRAGLAPQDAAWAWLTPCHFEVGMNEVRLSNPNGLPLPADQAQALTTAMASYFAEDGIALHSFADGRWLAHGEVFRGLATASTARVAGEDLKPWMPVSPLLRRLLNEMEMLLYTHPVNTAREARGQSPVNALWISGAGALAADARIDAPALNSMHDLAASARLGDWQTWGQAWRALDAAHCAPLLTRLRAGHDVALMLCGERTLQTWRSAPRSALARLSSLWRKPQLADLLGAL